MRFVLWILLSMVLGAQTRPALPRLINADQLCPPPTGETIVVAAGDNLQTAINAAQRGDTLLLQAGATFVGNFVLPAKEGEGCITIRTATSDEELPPATHRVGPTNSHMLAKLQGRGYIAARTVQTVPSSRGWRLFGLEITTDPEAGGEVTQIVGLGEIHTVEQMPRDIVIDRCWIHGHPSKAVRRGIMLNSGATVIQNSYISDIHVVGRESQGIAGWNGNGPYKIVNNRIEASGINILFGGEKQSAQNIIPSDIEIRNNHLFKPLEWNQYSLTYAGVRWAEKNSLEFKFGRRALVEANILENTWLDAQAGYAILLTPKGPGSIITGETGPIIEDITIRHNVILNAELGISLSGRDPYLYPAGLPPIVNTGPMVGRLSRVSIDSNVFHGVRKTWLQVQNSTENVSVTRNTVSNVSTTGFAVLFDGLKPHLNLIFRDNALNYSLYGIKGSGTASGTPTLIAYTSTGETLAQRVTGNVFQYSGTDKTIQSKYPTGNLFEAPGSEVSTRKGADLAVVGLATQHVLSGRQDAKPIYAMESSALNALKIWIDILLADQR